MHFIQPANSTSIHTSEHPFCTDMACACHHTLAALREYVIGPLADGTLPGELAILRYCGLIGTVASTEAKADPETYEQAS